MDQRNSKDQIRENYEEATVALFMDQYAAVLEAGIQEELAQQEQADFPQALEARCLEFIRKEAVRCRRQARRKRMLRSCRNAAIVVIALVGVCCFLYNTVDAIRIPVMNFIIEHHPQYTILANGDDLVPTPAEFNPDDPLGTILPDDFQMVDYLGSWEGECIVALYVNEMDVNVIFQMTPGGGVVQVDTEGAEVSYISVLGHDAIMAVEGENVQIDWLDVPLDKYFALTATNASEDVVLSYAEQVAALFD